MTNNNNLPLIAEVKYIDQETQTDLNTLNSCSLSGEDVGKLKDIMERKDKKIEQQDKIISDFIELLRKTSTGEQERGEPLQKKTIEILKQFN